MTSILKVDNIQNASGTSALSIDSSGRVTQPQIPCCFVQLTTSNAQDTSNPYTTTNTDIRFDKIITNQGNCYSESTGRITVPVAGIYEVQNFFITNNDTSSDHSTHLRKNDVIIHRSFNSTSNEHVQLVTHCLVDCNVGDYFTVHLNSGNIYINSDGSYSSFTVKLVG